MTEHTMDKKIETMTKECLYTALLLLMEKKPYEDITITEIAKKAGVSRMSYYRLYKSKDDILEQYADEVFRNLLNRIREMQNPDKKMAGGRTLPHLRGESPASEKCVSCQAV